MNLGTVIVLLLASMALPAQDSGSARDWASLIGQRFRVERDVVYKTIGTFQAKVDLYVRYDNSTGPTVLYIHGGGWANGGKEQYVLWFLPYLQLGMRVVSVQYRLSGVAPAPAAVEDCRCAFRWLAQHAGKYGIDTKRMVVSGGSSGGHLALMTGMLTPDAGFDRDCPWDAPPKPAAIIDYYGVTDVAELYRKGDPSALLWLRGVPKPEEMARRLSPLTYVRADLPPVLTLHGDADEMVPYSHSVRLHEALARAHVPNQLVTVPGGMHGRFRWTDADTIRVQRAIEQFLRQHGVLEK
ncbi:MAG: alpha/beta hydrolase [Candidatus Solibacter sp.]|jgi:acetyl esterase/lipase